MLIQVIPLLVFFICGSQFITVVQYVHIEEIFNGQFLLSYVPGLSENVLDALKTNK